MLKLGSQQLKFLVQCKKVSGPKPSPRATGVTRSRDPVTCVTLTNTNYSLRLDGFAHVITRSASSDVTKASISLQVSTLSYFLRVNCSILHVCSLKMPVTVPRRGLVSPCCLNFASECSPKKLDCNLHVLHSLPRPGQ